MALGRQLISFYLALSVALAGVIGTSPDLHVLIEHGGVGTAHSHLSLPQNNSPRSNVSPQSHTQHRTNAKSLHHPSLDRAENVLVSTHQAFTIGKIGPWQALCWLAHKIQVPTRPSNSPIHHDGEHHHESLAQSLISGLVELSADLPDCTHNFFLLRFYLAVPCQTFFGANWDFQTASRAPPVCLV